MAKVKYYDMYYSAKKPEPKLMLVNREQKIQNGASTKGAKIGSLSAGVQVIIDLVEAWDGWLRIIAVNGFDPVPTSWVDQQADKPVEEREWWIDRSALSEIVVDPDPVPVVVKRKWRITAEIEEIIE